MRVDGKIPVDNRMFSQHGAAEFRRCVTFVSQMPDVRKQNMELGGELSANSHCQKSSVELSNGETMEVLLQEETVISALYCDSSFYSVIGPEFCLVFDIMYTKTRTEAIAESFYHVQKHKMDVTRYGGKARGLERRHMPVYKDKRSWRSICAKW
ncbi:Hypothetical predicted protein [Paramuricea clavata]|uniref:Uncharacterized protein n=1 Tax=Paramuricea clavata TaxID=317549 RepID=A0A6S7GBX5_PARCT|nr:Hypothetical predicted protein [Paramuricea clavata]